MNKLQKTTTFRYLIPDIDQGKRIDVILSGRPEIASRNFAQHLIDKGFVSIDDQIVSKSYKVKAKQAITFVIPDPQEAELLPQDIPIEIVHEDKDLAVVVKPAGLVVHPSYGHWEGTLVNALLFHLKGLSAIGGVKRPGIVHRLDKDTSGLMLVAKNDKAHITLSEAIKNRYVARKYLALVEGVLQDRFFSIEAPIARDPVHRKQMIVQSNGRYARTNAQIIEILRNNTLLELSLVTGRTHQIRVHLAYIGHPVLGDQVYGKGNGAKKLGLNRHFLHAYKLSFKHPISGEEMNFQSPLPKELQETLRRLQ